MFIISMSSRFKGSSFCVLQTGVRRVIYCMSSNEQRNERRHHDMGEDMES
jgi:hypothetical protein